MRILIISASYPPVLGGLQTVAHSLAKHLLARNHEVRVVTNHFPRSLPGKQNLENIPVTRYLFLRPQAAYFLRKRWDMFLASLLYYPYTLYRLKRMFKDFQPDVVNLHYPDAQTPFVLWLLKRFQFRLIVSLHGDDVLSMAKEISNEGKESTAFRNVRSILQSADAVTACSKWLLEQAALIEPTVSERGIVIYNGIDLRRFEDKTAHSHSRPYIFAYGRLSYQKGFDLLLDAFAPLASAFPDVDLIIAGEGEAGGDLRIKTDQLGLGSRVHFWGRASSDEIEKLLNGSIFVAVPSRSGEAFGIVALEAMGAGKPVLATQVGGLRELVDGSDNLLVQPSVDGLTKGLNLWLGLFAKGELPVSNPANIDKKFSWHNMVSQYETILSG